MRCSGSQTTSTAADSFAAPSGAARDEEQAVLAFQAMLMSSVMKPLAEALGPVGSLVVDSVARAAILEPRKPAT
jgi:hypothetical protein